MGIGTRRGGGKCKRSSPPPSMENKKETFFAFSLVGWLFSLYGHPFAPFLRVGTFLYMGDHFSVCPPPLTKIYAVIHVKGFSFLNFVSML